VLVDTTSGPLLADLLVRAVTSQGSIAPQLDGRLRVVGR
jgi:hypothetical protein